MLLLRGTRLCLSLGLAVTLSACMVRTDRKIAYGLSHYEMGLYGLAIPPLLQAADRIVDDDPTDPRLPPVLDALGHMAASTRRPDLAEGFFRRDLAKCERLEPPDDRALERALVSLGLFLREHEQSAEAIALLERARDIASGWTDDREGYAIAIDNLGLAYASAERWDDAARASQASLEVLDAIPASSSVARTRSVVLYNRAVMLEERGRFEEADAEYRAAIRTFEGAAESEPNMETWRLGVMLRRYATFLRGRGRDAEAASVEARAESTL